MVADGCLECGDHLAHCHAAWVRHPDGHEECLVLSCRLGPEAHAIVVVCDEIDPACCVELPGQKG